MTADHTKPSLTQRITSASITGAATLGAMAVGTELYQFSTLPDAHFSPDYVQFAIPILTAGLAATKPGLAIYQELGFLVEKAGSFGYTPVRKLRQWMRGDTPLNLEGLTQVEKQRVEEEGREQEKVHSVPRQRRLGLAAAALALITGVSAFDRYKVSPGATWQPNIVDDMVRGVIGADRPESLWARAQWRSQYNTQRLSQDIPPITEYALGLPPPPIPGEDRSFIDWKAQIDSWYRNKLGIPQQSRVQIEFGGTRYYEGDFGWAFAHTLSTSTRMDDHNFLWVNGKLIETELRFNDDRNVACESVVNDAGIFVIYEVGHGGYTTDYQIRDVLRHTEYGPFSSISTNPGEQTLTGVLNTFPGRFSELIAWRPVGDGKVQAYFRRLKSQAQEAEHYAVPLGEAIKPLKFN